MGLFRDFQSIRVISPILILLTGLVLGLKKFCKNFLHLLWAQKILWASIGNEPNIPYMDFKLAK
jgi:hypothetical protein